LVQAGAITDGDLRIALAEHRRTGERVGAVLIRLELASEHQVTKALAYQLGFPYVSLAVDRPDVAAIVVIPRDVARTRVCVAVALEKDLLTVAVSDPLMFGLVRDLELLTGYRIRQIVATRTDILRAIEHGYPDDITSKEPGAGALMRHGEEVRVLPPCGAREAVDAAPIVDLLEIATGGPIAGRSRDGEPAEWCPHCGTRLNQECGSCGRPLQPGWAFCPYCAGRAAPGGRRRYAPRVRERRGNVPATQKQLGPSAPPR
jgi:hypothetical protein